jgi:hypothetical protein
MLERARIALVPLLLLTLAVVATYAVVHALQGHAVVIVLR